MSEPPWLAIARTYIGLREIPGPKHNPTIMGWVKRLGAKLGITVRDDETPWCGTFMAECFDRAGFHPPPIAVRASAWGEWGRKLIGPRLGCVLVFVRSGGGHVGLYIGEDAHSYHVLGGNQRNSVSIVPIAKHRLTSMRWPHGYPLPAQQVIRLAPNGKPSENEA